MEPLILALLLGGGLHLATRLEQRERIALLAAQLGRHGVERPMAQWLQDSLPALTEPDPERRTERLRALGVVEARLVEQLQALSGAMAELWGERTRVSRFPVALPWATRLFPRASFDLRALVALHAEGIARAVTNTDGLGERERAFRLTAELLLFQHSCHWFCRSRSVAHARLLAHHQTGYDQVLQHVGAPTRTAYLSLTTG